MVLSSFLSSLALLASVVSAGPLIERASSTPTVQVLNGTIQGVHSDSYNQDFFLGVPFARPPTGDLRFRNPASLNSKFGSTIQATKYAPYCVGYGSDSDGKPQSEDCLYLNVVRPSGYSGQKLPVLVWIHSSAFAYGGTSDPRFNLTYIVDNSVKIGKPIIAVSIAYRLHIWGFIASKEVTSAGSTNLGIKDQRIALQWLKENIGAFGGDGSKITIWGQSSGATSVGFQLLAYNGRDDGLFRGAIMQSGNPVNFISFKTDADYEAQYLSIVAATGCLPFFDNLSCLRIMPFPILQAAIVAQNKLIGNSLISLWNPIVDGGIIARYGSQQLAQGAFVKVPIIDGATSDEGTVFSPLFINSQQDIANKMSDTTQLVNIPQSLVPAALQAYPDNNVEYWIPSINYLGNVTLPFYLGNYEWRRSAAYFGDVVGIASRRATCQAWAKYGAAAYSYRFNTVVAGTVPALGATHFEDVSFVFNNTQGLGYSQDPYAGEAIGYFQLAKLMSSTWASFAYDQNPNGFNTRFPAAVPWPKYSTSSPQNIVWDANVTALTYTEPDTFRKTGIQWINDHATDYRR